MSSGGVASSKRLGRGSADSEESCPLTPELGFFDSDSRRGSCQENTERIKTGNGLALRARDAEGYRRGRVLCQIADAVDPHWHYSGIFPSGLLRQSGSDLHECQANDRAAAAAAQALSLQIRKE